MPKRNTRIEEQLLREEEKIRRLLGRAARIGAIYTRKKILGGSPTGTQWHVIANRRRGNDYGARRETGKMLDSVSFSRPKWNPQTKRYIATFGFPYAPNTFGNIRNVRPSAKYRSRIDEMRAPNFKPWASDKDYFARQEYGSEMPGVDKPYRGMHATRYGMREAQKYLESELGRMYKKGKK